MPADSRWDLIRALKGSNVLHCFRLGIQRYRMLLIHTRLPALYPKQIDGIHNKIYSHCHRSRILLSQCFYKRNILSERDMEHGIIALLGYYAAQGFVTGVSRQSVLPICKDQAVQGGRVGPRAGLDVLETSPLEPCRVTNLEEQRCFPFPLKL